MFVNYNLFFFFPAKTHLFCKPYNIYDVLSMIMKVQGNPDGRERRATKRHPNAIHSDKKSANGEVTCGRMWVRSSPTPPRCSCTSTMTQP